MRAAPLLALALLGTAAPQQRAPSAEPIVIVVAPGGPLDLKDAFAGAASAVNSTLGSGLRFAVVAGPASVARDGRNTAGFGPLDPSFHAFAWLWVEEGLVVEVGGDVPSSSYVDQLGRLDGVGDAIQRLEPGDEPAAIASAVELVLAGLHLNRRLNRQAAGGTYRYSI